MISVVIPAYNEARALPRALGALLAQSGNYEVIVVDGGSTDATRDIARSHDGVTLIEAVKGRASQLNAGADVARGHWLLFLHADTLLPEGALLRIAALGDDCGAGAFRHRFSGDDWRLRLISWGNNQRCRWTRIYYGDQAMFVRIALFRRLGGFPECDMLEDVLLSEKLRRATRPVLLDQHVVTDGRKFLQMGVVRSVARALVVLACHQMGLPLRGREFFRDVR